MSYVSGDAKRSECVFCSLLADDHGSDSLILLRSQHSFVIMNIYPYNTGHVMVVPNKHVASPELLPDAALLDMTALRNRLLQATRAALSPDGFNVGINLGEVAGAGIAMHLHEHIVPRWTGDANFMPIVGGTKVLPELLPATYAKLRAEIERISGRIEVPGLYLSPDCEEVFVTNSASIPRVTADPGAAIWRALANDALSRGLRGFEILGWGGTAKFLNDAPVILHRLTGRYEDCESPVGRWLPLEEAVSGPDGVLIEMIRPRIASFKSGNTPSQTHP
jgi:ATP adenylyltransferase